MLNSLIPHASQLLYLYQCNADDWAKADENGSSGSGDDGGGGSPNGATDGEEEEGMEISATEAPKPKKKPVDTKKVEKKNHFNIVFIGHVGLYQIFNLQ